MLQEEKIKRVQHSDQSGPSIGSPPPCSSTHPLYFAVQTRGDGSKWKLIICKQGLRMTLLCFFFLYTLQISLVLLRNIIYSTCNTTMCTHAGTESASYSVGLTHREKKRGNVNLPNLCGNKTLKLPEL